MKANNTCKIVVGRLLEIRVGGGYESVGDVDAMIAAIARTIEALPDEVQVVVAADWRACSLFTPEVAQRVTEMLTHNSDRIERSGILHDASQPTSVLQVFRLIKEAHVLDARRRIFTSKPDMFAFLSELLDDRERERLRALLELPG
jgi:hypothetical protein